MAGKRERPKAEALSANFEWQSLANKHAPRLSGRALIGPTTRIEARANPTVAWYGTYLSYLLPCFVPFGVARLGQSYGWADGTDFLLGRVSQNAKSERLSALTEEGLVYEVQGCRI